MLQPIQTGPAQFRPNPAERAADSPPAAALRASLSERSEALGAALKTNILLVDDEPGKLLAHEAVLLELGENVIKATSGKEALELLLRTEFAVILLDVRLPDLDGFEVANLIRQRPSLERTPIIFLTAYNTSDLDRLRAYNIGAADYLFLPVVPAVLKAKVQVFVDLAKQRQIIQRQADYLSWHNQRQNEQIRTIQELNQKLKTVNEELESFSYSISHDLRGPLRALQGYAEILVDDFASGLNPEAYEFLKRINRAAFRMDLLIQDVLAYSRISKQDIALGSVNVETLLADLISQNRALHQARAFIHVQSPIHKVIGHEPSLAQTLSNLIDNAVKFVGDGVTPRVTVRSELRSDQARIWVEDNGIGIDRSHHQRIFQMFERLDQQYEGTGIGLAIVKKAMDRMGGQVGVESEPGGGSRFWIELAASK